MTNLKCERNNNFSLLVAPDVLDVFSMCALNALILHLAHERIYKHVIIPKYNSACIPHRQMYTTCEDLPPCVRRTFLLM